MPGDSCYCCNVWTINSAHSTIWALEILQIPDRTEMIRRKFHGSRQWDALLWLKYLAVVTALSGGYCVIRLGDAMGIWINYFKS